MKKRILFIGLFGLLLFAIYTILVCTVDRQAIGIRVPVDGQPSYVGFATMNKWFQELHEPNITLYKITDWGSIPAIAIGLVFAIYGLYQWCTRKRLEKVDFNILMLGVTYIVLFAFFIIFLFCPINYRPVMVSDKPETSYPSSTTLLAIGFLSTAILNNYIYIKKKYVAHIVSGVEIAYMLFLIVGRIISRVHWLSDVIGALILGISIFLIYLSIYKYKPATKEE